MITSLGTVTPCRAIDRMEGSNMHDYRPENHTCGAETVVSAFALVVPVISAVSVAMFL